MSSRFTPSGRGWVAAAAAAAAVASLLLLRAHRRRRRRPWPRRGGGPFVPARVADARRVLVLGDGNLSWSLAVVRALLRRRRRAAASDDGSDAGAATPPVRTETLHVTTYDTVAQLRDKYAEDGIDDVLDELRAAAVIPSSSSSSSSSSFPHITLAHGVDATNLTDHVGPAARFDLVVWNFPHWGGRGYIQKNRRLLKAFFLSVAPHVASGGEVHVALKAGQGGTPVDKALGAMGNTWRAVENAAWGQLVLAAVPPFAPPEGYYCSGRRSTARGFFLGGALNHVFVPADDARRPAGVPPAGLHPPTYTFDVSFWVLDAAKYTPAAVLAVCCACEPCVRRCTLEHEIVARPRDTRIATKEIPSMAFRVTYRSTTGPETRTSMLARHDALRATLGRTLYPTILVRGSMAFQEPFVQARLRGDGVVPGAYSRLEC